jgi:hypothetical protein
MWPIDRVIARLFMPINGNERTKKKTLVSQRIKPFARVNRSKVFTTTVMPLPLCLLSFTLVLIAINGQQLILKRDFPASYQFNSFGVFSVDERHVVYRIETQYSLTYAATIKRLLPLNDFILVAQIDAFLGSDQAFNFRLLDAQRGLWLSGRIYQESALIYVMELADFNRMIIELSVPWTPGMSSLSTVRFLDGHHIHADYVQRTPWLSTYDLRVLSNDYPVELYLIGFAVTQRRNSRIRLV